MNIDINNNSNIINNKKDNVIIESTTDLSVKNIYNLNKNFFLINSLFFNNYNYL